MSTAFMGADILLPKDTDMTKWAVIACDQYTSEPKYWEDAEKITENCPSALKLILPEVYLEDSDVDKRIDEIHENMSDYLDNGMFKEYKNSMIYVERVQSDGKLRQGLVGMIDLEQYDYNKGSVSPVRATEATIVERIPPRIKIRNGAQIELPHIMILVDDENKTVIEPLESKKASFEKAYDFKLMKNGGSIKGYVIDKESSDNVTLALEKLGDINCFNEKYKLHETSPLVYAMGDGNHSLATAKEFYEQQKAKNPNKDMTNAPCRYALVEIVNLHSPALQFEAIHRFCTQINSQKLLSAMIIALDLKKTPSEQKITVVGKGHETDLYVHAPTSKLAVGSLQNFLDSYLKENGGKIDYVHGGDTVRELTSKTENSIGFLLPDMSKSQLFPTVIGDGALPRKTFSMGHADDKRFYVEARKISE